MLALLRLVGPDVHREVPLDPSGAELTLGRDASADIQLVDAEKFISRRHVVLRSAGDWVEMHIASRVNGALTSRGSVRPGESARLVEGDYFVLGPYTITVCRAPAGFALADAGLRPDLSDPDLQTQVQRVVPNTAVISTSIDHWLSKRSGDDLDLSGDEAPAHNQSQATPTREERTDAPVNGGSLGYGPPPEHPEAALGAHTDNMPRPRTGTGAGEPLPAGGAEALWAAFVKGLGLPTTHLVDEQTALQAGRMVGLLTKGLADLLGVRAQIRRELRVADRTMLTGHDTNQFKAGLPISELIQYLFSAHVGAGYMQPDRAVRECITELQVHEHATLMAVRAALEGALREFEPSKLQREMLAHRASVFQMLNNARSWQAYQGYYDKRALNLADWLEKIFERHFTETYTRESNRLKIMHGRPADP